jgi:hypothetical protein
MNCSASQPAIPPIMMAGVRRESGNCITGISLPGEMAPPAYSSQASVCVAKDRVASSTGAFALLAVAVLAAVDARRSVAEIYRPWCVSYPWIGTTCTFMSFEQCMMTAVPALADQTHRILGIWHMAKGRKNRPHPRRSVSNASRLGAATVHAAISRHFERDAILYALENICISESEFAKTLSSGGRIRTCASGLRGDRAEPQSSLGQSLALAHLIRRCRGSNPAAPTSQSVSHFRTKCIAA